jgi:hypothetical protein
MLFLVNLLANKIKCDQVKVMRIKLNKSLSIPIPIPLSIFFLSQIVKDVIILEIRLKLLSKEHRNISNTEKTLIAHKKFIKEKGWTIQINKSTYQAKCSRTIFLPSFP